MPHSDGWKLAQERLIVMRIHSLKTALQYGTKSQILWNTRNLLSLVKEYSK